MESIAELVQRRYGGYEVKAVIDRVASTAGNWYTVVFVSCGSENKILFTEPFTGDLLTVAYEYTDITKEIGNAFYRELKSTAQSDEKGEWYKDTKDSVLSRLWRSRVARNLGNHKMALEVYRVGKEKTIRI